MEIGEESDINTVRLTVPVRSESDASTRVASSSQLQSTQGIVFIENSRIHLKGVLLLLTHVCFNLGDSVVFSDVESSQFALGSASSAALFRASAIT